MEQYAIKGGNPLVGEVEIGGAKNAALPILAASVMTDETVYIENMPDVRDTNVLLCAMENIGVIVKRTDRHKVTLNASNISELVVEDENIKKIRASYYLIGALCRTGKRSGSGKENFRTGFCLYPGHSEFFACDRPVFKAAAGRVVETHCFYVR